MVQKIFKKNETNWGELIKITKNKELTEDNFLKFLKKKAKS